MKKTLENTTNSSSLVTKRNTSDIMPGGYLIKPKPFATTIQNVDINPNMHVIMETIKAQKIVKKEMKKNVEGAVTDNKKELVEKLPSNALENILALIKNINVNPLPAKVDIEKDAAKEEVSDLEKAEKVISTVDEYKKIVKKELVEVQDLLKQIKPSIKKKEFVTFHVSTKNEKPFKITHNKIDKNNPNLSQLYFAPTAIYVQEIKNIHHRYKWNCSKGDINTFAFIQDLVIKYKQNLLQYSVQMEDFLAFQNDFKNALFIVSKKYNSNLTQRNLFILFTKNVNEIVQELTYCNYNQITSMKPENMLSLDHIHPKGVADTDFPKNFSVYLKQCISYLYYLELQ